MNKLNYFLKGNVGWAGYFVPLGSRNESNSVKGISHLLEHMMFKGSKSRIKEQISKEIESWGADLNAFTDFETVCYWIKASNKYIDKIKPVLEDMVFNSILPEKELEKEKQVVLQEIKMYYDSPRYYIWKLVGEALFSENSGLKMPIVGTKEIVESITREQLLNWYSKYNVTQVNISNDIAKIEKRLILPTQCTLEKINYSNDDYFVERDSLQQANVVIGGLIHSSVDVTTRYKYNLLSAVFNDMSGRLFKIIRGDNNLVYSTYLCFEHFTCGTTMWAVFCGLDKRNIGKAEKLILQELQTFITQEELDYAKQKLIGQMELELNDPKVIGKTILYSTLHSLDYLAFTNDYEKYINSITLDELNEFFESIDFDNKRVVGVLPK